MKARIDSARRPPPDPRTHIGHLGHTGHVEVLGEAGLVVVNVVDLDDELALALQRLVGEAVHRLGAQDVVGLLLAVQPLRGVDVARLLVDAEQGAGALTRQHVAGAAVAAVPVRVELEEGGGGGGRRQRGQRWTTTGDTNGLQIISDCDQKIELNSTGTPDLRRLQVNDCPALNISPLHLQMDHNPKWTTTQQ